MRAQLILLVCALAVGNSTQEDNCGQEIDAAVSALKGQTASLTAERDAFQAEVSECRDGYSKLYKTWQAQAEDVAALQASITDLKVKVREAEEKLFKASTGAPPKLDLPIIVTLLVEHAKDSALSAVETGKAVFQELKGGKTDRLTSLLGGLLASLRGAASSTVAFVKMEAEEHLPDSVKRQISEGVAKAHALWKQHVTDAAWAQPALKQLGSVNDELKKVVTKALSSHPALASLADPVTVQLFVYSVFALPVLVLLVLPLALLGGKKPSIDARATPSKGKKHRGKGRA